MEGLVLNGRYRLLSRIATGSMGQVWRCFDEVIGREVAAKLLLGVGSAPAALARFDREARLAGVLSCPSIVTVHDYGHADLDGVPVAYLIMELLTGRTLARILDDGGLPELGRVLVWGLQICDALAAAHQAGVVHRDIKPDNVMVTADGTVKVLDFGIARFAESEGIHGGLTTSGHFVGTAAYMSPEQAQGQGLDARSDLYSLGCLLYALTTGRPPFLGDTLASLVFQHVSMTPAAPSTLRPEVPWSLDRLIMTLLAKEPDNRPADAASVRDLLAALLQGHSARAQSDPADLLYALGARFAAEHHPDKALRPAAAAVELRRLMAAAQPERYRVPLAAALHSLALVYCDLGRFEDALPAATEAVAVYRLCADADPLRNDAALAASLHTLGLVNSRLARPEDAVSPAWEAVDVYRSLADEDPARHEGDLARALHDLNLVYSALDRHEDALPIALEACDMYQSLAEANPDRYSRDLAAALTNLGAAFAALDRRPQALLSTLEAVGLYRSLAAGDSGRYGSDLAGALTNLAGLFTGLGRQEDAEQALGEAEQLLRGGDHRA